MSHWKNGVPTANMHASVAANLTVTVDFDAPEYYGQLTMQEGALLRLAWLSSHAGIANAVSGTFRIVMESGSEILSNLPRDIEFPPIELRGDAKISMPSTGAHGRSFSFQTIQGEHEFALVSCNRCSYYFEQPSNVLEFSVTASGTSSLHAMSPGCFGNGDVSLSLGPNYGRVNLYLDSQGVFAETSTLSLTTFNSTRGFIVVYLSGGTHTIRSLIVDNTWMPAGTYSEGNDYMQGALLFSGMGRLLVTE